MYPGVDPTDLMKEESVGENGEAFRKAAELKFTVQQAIKDEFAITDAWDQKELYFELSCPSGQKCLAKKLDTMDLVESDLLDEIDYFSRKLMPAKLDETGTPIDNEEPQEVSISKLLKDPEKKKRLFSLLDGLMSVAVVKPKVHALPSDVKIEEYRNWIGFPLPPGEVWANRVNLTDKMFIFGELNKPLDEIAKFRFESPTSLEHMVTMESVSRKTE